MDASTHVQTFQALGIYIFQLVRYIMKTSVSYHLLLAVYDNQDLTQI